MLHKNLYAGDVHCIHNWEVLAVADLLDIVTGEIDRGKVAWVLSDDSLHWLANPLLKKWVPFTGVVEGANGTNGVDAVNSIRGAFAGPVVASVGTIRYYLRDDINITSIFANLSGPATVAVVAKIKKNGADAQTVTIPLGAETSTTTTAISLLSTDYLTIDVISGTGSNLAIRLDFERV